MSRRIAFRQRKIDPHKRLQVVRSHDDSLIFTDETGTVHHAARSGATGSAAAVPVKKKQKKKSLPIPQVLRVPDYDSLHKKNYKPDLAYVMYRPFPYQDIDWDHVTYNLQKGDMDWLASHPKWGPKGTEPRRLTQDSLERVIDLCEKVSGKGIATLSAVEPVVAQYCEMYKATHGRLVSDVFHYWKAKRLKNKKSLLWQFWPPTSVQDTNPHHVFRAREKERYRLRKHRKDDMEAFRKLQQLREELQRGLDLVAMTRRREQAKRVLLAIAEDQFEQAMHELCDTTGKKRVPKSLQTRKATREMLKITDHKKPQRDDRPHVIKKPRVEPPVPQQAPASQMAPITLAGTLGPSMRALEVDKPYEDGLGLGVALGLSLGGKLGTAPEADAMFRGVVQPRDIGGMSAVAGVGRRGPAWEIADGLVPGIGAMAGQGRGGALNWRPEAAAPCIDTYPPPSESWMPWAAHVDDEVPDDVRVAGAGVVVREPVWKPDVPKRKAQPAGVKSEPGARAAGASDRKVEESAASLGLRVSATAAILAGPRVVDVAAEAGGDDDVVMVSDGPAGAASSDTDSDDSDEPPRRMFRRRLRVSRRLPRFACRTRVGRGGRVIIDRLPLSQQTAVHHAKSLARLRGKFLARIGEAQQHERGARAAGAAGETEAARRSFRSRFSADPKYAAEKPGIAGAWALKDEAARAPSAVAAAPSLRVDRKKLAEVCGQSDSEDEGLVAMSFAGLSGAASLGVELDKWD